MTDEEASTWDIVKNPKFADRIFIKDSARDVYSQLILKVKEQEIAEGKVTIDQLMNYTSDADIAAVEEYMKDVKPLVAGWEADFGKDQMVQELGYVNLTWSGDGVWAIDEAAELGVELRYAVVRPEDIYFTTDPAKCQFKAKVNSCIFKGVHYEMWVDTDTGYELMIQDYDPYPVGSEVMLYIDPDDIQVMKKERLCNTLYGTVKDAETVTLLDADFPLKSGFEPGTEVKVEIPFEAVDLMDNLDDGIIDGEVHFILYMGDHYHLTIKTDDGDSLWVDTNDIWDKGDLVGIRLNPENSKKEIKITKKDEQEK